MSLNNSHATASGSSSNLWALAHGITRRAALLAGGALAFGLCFLVQGTIVDQALDDWHGNVAASQPTARQIR